jgi:hypothetical protein
MGLGDFIAGHGMVEVMPEKNLSILVFGLEVAASDGHDALVGSVVYVASHGGPLGDAFDMVGHDPSMLKIPATLHALNQVDTTTGADLRHLENENFVGFVTLAWELILPDVGRMQLLAMIKNGFKFFHGKELMKNTIIAEEELTNKVLAGLKSNFVVSGLGRSFHVLLD